MIRSPRKILLIDGSPQDSPTFHLYREGLPETVYEVRQEREETALTTVRTFQPDCLLINYQLLNLHVAEFLAHLRKADGLLPYGVVIVNVPDEKLEEKEAREHGAIDYLSIRETTVESLHRVVAHAIEKRDLAVQQWAGNLRDHELQLTLAALQTSEETFQVALQGSPLLVFRHDPSLRYTWVCNPPPVFSPTDFIGKRDEDLFSTEDALALTQVKRRVLETGVPERVQVRLTVNQETRVYEVTVKPKYDSTGKIVGLIGTSADITARAQAEELLRRSSAKFTRQVLERTAELTKANEVLGTQVAVLKNLAAGVAVINKDGTILFTNRAFDLMFGYAENELLGQSVLILNAEAKQESTSITGQLLTHVSIYGSWRGELQSCTKAGGWFTTYARLSAVALGEQQHIIMVQEDITERKRLESDLRQRERLSIIGTTAVRLTHEVGNRLNSISTTIQVLERHLAYHNIPVDAEFAELLQDLRGEVERLRLILQDIRMLTNLDQLKLQPVDIAALTQGIMNEHLSTFTARGIRVEQQFSADLPRVMADWEKLSQVILNLSMNAEEAMPHGGVLTIRASAVDRQLRLEVQDTGEGIPQGVDIFDAFTTTKPGGTGLGLTIVQHLIAAHNGTIAYTSAAGRGTTFILTIPAAPPTVTHGDR